MRSRAPLASLSGIGPDTQEPEPFRTVAAEGPCREARPKPRRTTPSLHRARAALFSAGNEAEAPVHRVDSRQPRFHEPGDGGGRSHTRHARSDAPLRAPASEHYPDPIRSDTSRRGTVAAPAGDSSAARSPRHAEATRGTAPVRERHLDDPTARAPPPRRVGAHGPTTTRSRAVAGRALPRLVSRRAWRVAARDVSLARTHPGPRAALPTLPRRRAGAAAPEVPSVGEPATPASTGLKPRLRTVRTERAARGPGFVHRLLPTCGQYSTPLCNPHGSGALDGATVTRSSGDAAEAEPLPTCRGLAGPRPCQGEGRNPTSRQARTKRLHRFLRSERSAARCAAELPREKVALSTPVCNENNQAGRASFVHMVLHRFCPLQRPTTPLFSP